MGGPANSPAMAIFRRCRVPSGKSKTDDFGAYSISRWDYRRDYELQLARLGYVNASQRIAVKAGSAFVPVQGDREHAPTAT